MPGEWRIWQLADSAFPSGALAHSGGLEAAVQAGWVTDGASLEAFLAAARRQIESGVLVFVRLAWRETDGFDETDRRCDLFLNNHIANRASRAQGRAFLASAGRVFGVGAIEQLAACVRKDQKPAHFATVFGYVSRRLELTERTAVSLFVFLAMRSWLSSAVRLGVIGPIEAQRIQASFSEPALREDGDLQTAVQTSPLLDLIQGTQDRMYSRLFQS